MRCHQNINSHHVNGAVGVRRHRHVVQYATLKQKRCRNIRCGMVSVMPGASNPARSGVAAASATRVLQCAGLEGGYVMLRVSMSYAV